MHDQKTVKLIMEGIDYSAHAYIQSRALSACMHALIGETCKLHRSIYTYTHIHAHTHTHAHMHIYTHTYTHTRTHMHIYKHDAQIYSVSPCCMVAIYLALLIDIGTCMHGIPDCI